MSNPHTPNLQALVTALPQVCQKAGVSPNTPAICAQILDRQTGLDQRIGLEICLVILMIDLANAHTQTVMDAGTLQARLEMLTEGVELPADTSGQWHAIANHLAQIAPSLGQLRINQQAVVIRYAEHTYQIARIAHLEASVAVMVGAMSNTHYNLDLDAGRVASHLTDEQHNAVLASIKSKLSIIVGGPGTGKTSIIVELLRMVYELGIKPERMVLAAPTGKAAYRMGESVSNALQRYQDAHNAALQERLPTPMTLHRLLDYRPWSGQFGRHSQSPIPADVVIIDEASMVDLELFLHVIDGLAPSTRLVLLGDPGQLPSVGSGAVLRDLVSGGSVQVSRLTKSFRMNESDPAGSQIYQASRQILDAPDAIGGLPTYDMNWSTWTTNAPEGIHCSELTAADYLRFVRLWYERFYTDETWLGLTNRWSWNSDEKPSELPGIETVFERFQTARILSPTRVGPQGTIRLNEHFAQNIRKAIGGNTLNGFGVGDLVICNRNDYRLELFNGDQGVVIKNASASGESALWVAFEGGAELRLYPLHMVTQLLEYAFVLTVHKSQGSEFETIALSLPIQSAMTISRPLVYTAITRAKREVLVLGSAHQLMSASQTPLERFTTLESRLSDAAQIEVSQ